MNRIRIACLVLAILPSAVHAGEVFRGSASFYDPRTRDPNLGGHKAGGMGMADGTRYADGDLHCSVVTWRYLSGLRHHTIEVCDAASPRKCIRCYVTDNGPGVKGVDLTPTDWKKFGYPMVKGRFNVIIRDLGRGDLRKAQGTEPEPIAEPELKVAQRSASRFPAFLSRFLDRSRPNCGPTLALASARATGQMQQPKRPPGKPSQGFFQRLFGP